MSNTGNNSRSTARGRPLPDGPLSLGQMLAKARSQADAHRMPPSAAPLAREASTSQVSAFSALQSRALIAAKQRDISWTRALGARVLPETAHFVVFLAFCRGGFQEGLLALFEAGWSAQNNLSSLADAASEKQQWELLDWLERLGARATNPRDMEALRQWQRGAGVRPAPGSLANATGGAFSMGAPASVPLATDFFASPSDAPQVHSESPPESQEPSSTQTIAPSPIESDAPIDASASLVEATYESKGTAEAVDSAFSFFDDLNLGDSEDSPANASDETDDVQERVDAGNDIGNDSPLDLAAPPLAGNVETPSDDSSILGSGEEVEGEGEWRPPASEPPNVSELQGFDFSFPPDSTNASDAQPTSQPEGQSDSPSVERATTKATALSASAEKQRSESIEEQYLRLFSGPSDTEPSSVDALSSTETEGEAPPGDAPAHPSTDEPQATTLLPEGLASHDHSQGPVAESEEDPEEQTTSGFEAHRSSSLTTKGTQTEQSYPSFLRGESLQDALDRMFPSESSPASVPLPAEASSSVHSEHRTAHSVEDQSEPLSSPEETIADTDAFGPIAESAESVAGERLHEPLLSLHDDVKNQEEASPASLYPSCDTPAQELDSHHLAAEPHQMDTGSAPMEQAEKEQIEDLDLWTLSANQDPSTVSLASTETRPTDFVSPSDSTQNEVDKLAGELLQPTGVSASTAEEHSSSEVDASPDSLREELPLKTEASASSAMDLDWMDNELSQLSSVVTRPAVSVKSSPTEKPDFEALLDELFPESASSAPTQSVLHSQSLESFSSTVSASSSTSVSDTDSTVDSAVDAAAGSTVDLESARPALVLALNEPANPTRQPEPPPPSNANGSDDFLNDLFDELLPESNSQHSH